MMIHRYWQFLAIMALAAVSASVVSAQAPQPRRGGEPPAARGPNPRAEDRARGGEPGPRRPPQGGPGFEPPLDSFGPPGPGGPRGRGASRGFPGGMGFPSDGGPNDPEMAELLRQDAELEQQTRLLVQRVQQMKRQSEELDRAKEELKEVVTKHFDVRQKRRELQVQRLEEELKRLQAAVAKRNDARDEIIQKRLLDLSGQPEDLEF